MSPFSCDPGCARPSAAEAARAQARIYALFTRARDEVRPLTAAERAEYERLRAVYVRAVLAA